VDRIDAGLESLFENAETNRAEIARAAELDRSQIEKRLMAKSIIRITSRGEYRSFSDNEPDMVMFMVGVDLPIWQSKYRAGVKEAERTIDSNRPPWKRRKNRPRWRSGQPTSTR